MNQSLAVSAPQRNSFLFLTVGIITCLILLINVSFKIILVQGLVFSVNSILCPMVAALYLLVLRHCSFKEQRQALNIALMTLYLFCIGIYILVNLPAAEYMHDNQVYQIIFEDIPKKFFATTISFVLGFYLPHLLFCRRTNAELLLPQQAMLLALLGGLGFFASDFFLLFSGPHTHSFKQIFIDSLMIAILLLLVIGIIYLSFFLGEKREKNKLLKADAIFPLYQYFVCFAVAVTLMCLACEYRIVAFSQHGVLAASALFFPITLIISTLVGELWGYKANFKLILVLLTTQFIFDGFLMGLVAFPSPAFFNLNPFYNYIMPRRLPAAFFALFISFGSNALLLYYLKKFSWSQHRAVRILIANICANSLLCLVDYSLLFGGIYPYEQIVNLAVNVWQYKLLMTLVSLPLVLWICTSLEQQSPGCKQPGYAGKNKEHENM